MELLRETGLTAIVYVRIGDLYAQMSSRLLRLQAANPNWQFLFQWFQFHQRDLPGRPLKEPCL